MIAKVTEEKKKQVGVKKPSMAVLRLQKDLKIYEESEIEFVKLIFPEEQNLQKIEVEIRLSVNKEINQGIQCIYNKTVTKFLLVFPDSYPMQPPKLKCLNRIYHPNINYNGSVCLPLVREDWSPTVTISSIICGLIYILQFPNADDALEPEVGDQLKSDPILFQKIVDHTKQGRSFRNKQYDNIKL